MKHSSDCSSWRPLQIIMSELKKVENWFKQLELLDMEAFVLLFALAYNL